LNAYILAADPTWIRTSVMRYYDAIDRLIVCFDVQGRGWTGAPIDVEACLAAVRDIDHDGKVVLAPGDFSDPGRIPAQAESRQRQAALALAGEDADWVLQIDTDEVLPHVQPLLHLLQEAGERDIASVEWPMRVLYRRMAPGRYLQVVRRDGAVHIEYPGPVAVRPGTSLVHCRRADGRFVRPVPTSGVGSLQLAREPEPNEVRIQHAMEVDDVIVHNSWGRSPAAVRAKVAAWGHNQGLRTRLYYLSKWLPSRYTWPVLRDFHPFAEDLWPRLAPYEMLGVPVHPMETGQ
jgi:hypothetical protein